MADLYIGLMSGTSLDGVDAVLVRFDAGSETKPDTDVDTAADSPRIRVVAHVHAPFSPDLRDALLALNSAGANELHRAALAGNSLSRAYAAAVADLLRAAPALPSPVKAIGAHGQTVRHRPGDFDGIGYTVQLINGALLAELTGIDTVCDFRSRDVAAGGQGAPLVPSFHAAMFGQPGLAQALLNLGGIANLTLLDGRGGVQGFDCGPGNGLMDSWCQRHTGRPYDDQGRWAASGTSIPGLLTRLMAEPFLARAAPKSTGRDLFNDLWLQAALDDAHATTAAAADVQATLADFTALSAATALRSHLPQAERLLICGGGALNRHLLQRLSAYLPGQPIGTTDALGLPASQVEATAFAWLCREFIERRPANCPTVTGAHGARRLGAHYPA